jgi:metacaspase-1
MRCVLAAFCFLLAVGTAGAETRALLIGVSDYDDSIGLADLKGPANDVALLDGVLRGRGVTDVTLLADGIAGSTRPTRAAILGAFDAMEARAVKGDFVYIHLSGHGTRQPDTDGDETDGLDEVFLPADVAHAKPGESLIPNAVIDDEIGAAVRRIRAKGADVWLVMDACHSGSGLRAASADTATRFVDPATLGITATGAPVAEAGAVAGPDEDPGGDYLAFYAARSTEVAREVNLAEPGAPGAWYGLFSAKLAARLQSGGAISFRQLFQAVLSDMKDGTVPGAARMQTPSWEGTLIDAAVFGGSGTSGLRRFAVTGDEMAAGLVHGLEAGTLVGLVADAADPPEAILSFAQTEDPGATFSYLRPVAEGCVPLADAPCPATGSLPPGTRFAQVIAAPQDRQTRLSYPVDLASGAPLPPDDPARVALEAAVAEAGQAVALSQDDFAVEVIWDGRALWFGPRAQVDGTPMGLRWSHETEDLSDLLVRIGRAESLARMLGAVAAGGSILSPSPVAVTAEYAPVEVADLAGLAEEVNPRRECRRAVGNVMSRARQPLAAGTDLKQCDQLTFAAQGAVAGARDVNRVHIDAHFCVTAEYERVEDVSVPRRLGPEMTLCSDCPDFAAGEERLFVVTTEGTENSEALNLEGLVETCGTGGGTRGDTAAVQAMDFLATVAARPDTRGSLGGLGLSGIWVEEFNWRVLPRRAAFARAGRSLED